MDSLLGQASRKADRLGSTMWSVSDFSFSSEAQEWKEISDNFKLIHRNGSCTTSCLSSLMVAKQHHLHDNYNGDVKTAVARFPSPQFLPSATGTGQICLIFVYTFFKPMEHSEDYINSRLFPAVSLREQITQYKWQQIRTVMWNKKRK